MARDDPRINERFVCFVCVSCAFRGGSVAFTTLVRENAPCAPLPCLVDSDTATPCPGVWRYRVGPCGAFWYAVLRLGLCPDYPYAPILWRCPAQNAPCAPVGHAPVLRSRCHAPVPRVPRFDAPGPCHGGARAPPFWHADYIGSRYNICSVLLDLLRPVSGLLPSLAPRPLFMLKQCVCIHQTMLKQCIRNAEAMLARGMLTQC